MSVGNGGEGRLGSSSLDMTETGSVVGEDRRRTDRDWESADLESVKGVKDWEL
jgi:hypothetical protein